MDDSTPSEPSLWNNQAFNVVEFAVHFFSLSENFSSDYQLFSDMFPSQLSALPETQLVRFFLVEKASRGKYSRTFRGLHPRMVNVNKGTCGSGVVKKQLRER